MFKIFLFLIAFLSTSLIFSQSNSGYKESFDDPANTSWQTENTELKESSISNGSLVLKNKSENPVYFKNEYQIDPTLDFSIKISFKFIDGPDSNSSYGIYLTDTRKSKNIQYKYFLIGSDSTYSICENSSTDGRYKFHKAAIENRIKFTASNTLSIEKKEKTYYFYLNQKLIHQQNNISFWGNYVGITLINKNTIHIEDIIIKQQLPPLNLAATDGIKHIKENLGSEINSPFEELMPIISPDGQTLYMTVIEPANVGGNKTSDIWISTQNHDGTWTKRKNIGAPLNTEQSNFIVSAPPDNNSLILQGIYKIENGEHTTVRGLSITNKNNEEWSYPSELSIKNYYSNSSRTTACMSPNQKVIILDLERNDSYGRNDIYVSFLEKDGSWSAPKNMGPTLNTYADDGTPFIAADGKTLYYSSAGKRGYGSNDIFVSTRLDESWTNWSEPVNLGPDINTSHWDAYYTIPASGDYAYIVSDDKTGYGLSDIYRIKVSETTKPKPVVIIYGKTFNKSTNKPIGTHITYHDMSTGEEAGIATSNPLDGTYKIVLPYGKVYGFLAEKENFLSESNNTDLTDVKKFKEIRQNLYLSPIENGKMITLNNVFFVKSKAELLPGSTIELDRLVKVLKSNPTISIDLSGHTDNVGDADKNIELSQQRVDVIKKYLAAKGIDSTRVSGKGYGSTKPVANNDTEETRKLNRRVEFKIVVGD
jgi:outer membrane protein OmpA-like peptidoglycan-associated protein